MIVVSEPTWVDGHIRYGHFECEVPKELEEKFKNMSKEDQINYLKDNGELLIDDFEINDYGEISETYIEE